MMSLIGGGLAMMALAPAAAASPQISPMAALTQAQAQLQALSATADPSAQSDLDDAVSELTAATAAYLWPDPSDALPPPTGDLVFTDAEDALADEAKIRHDGTVASNALASASNEIAEACGGLAQAALRRAGLHGTAGGRNSVSEDQAEYDRAFGTLAAEITNAITNVPRQTVEQSAEDFLRSPNHFASAPHELSGSPLTLAGEPELFYYGAEFCPFCAVTRWSMALALTQFGKLSALALSESTPIDFAPSTNTITFDRSSYDSPLLAFAPVEVASNQLCTYGASGCGVYGFTTLQTPNATEQRIVSQDDPNGGLPFLDFGNRWQDGSVVWPPVLAGLSWEQIAAALNDPSSTVGQYLDGGAELFAAQICETTGEQPSRVCETPVNQQYQQLLSAPTASVDGTNYLIGVSCPSSSLCATVDGAGNALITQDATAATPTWTAPDSIDGSTSLSAVACPSVSLCVAADASGNALVTHDANASDPTWSMPDDIDGTNYITYVRCPSTSLCVAVDTAGNAIVTHDPSNPTPTWSAPDNIDGTNSLTLACPSTSLCVAGDSAGNTLVTRDPGDAMPSWSAPRKSDPQAEIGDISCPSTSLCVAVDYSGDTLITRDPNAATPAWSTPAAVDDGNALFAVSCPSTSLCVAVDENGNAVVSDDPNAHSPTWTIESVDSASLYDVSCPSTSLCVAVDDDGTAIETDNPTAPTPTWGPPAKFQHS